ncbi:MAG: nucleotide exchange factor GrpE [Flavobacteriales bacterium]|nr:nucleotide exchange factor GrpE [Flavobacteriales bacterium]
MSEKPETNGRATAGENVIVNEAARQAAAAAEELGHASEAAAEHTMADQENALVAENEKLKAEVAALNDKYLRLNAEFDNARKRSAKERIELLQFAGENVLKNVIPVVDDMERAIAHNEGVDDIKAVKEGFNLIHGKLLHILGAQGLKPMTDVKGKPFDTDRHEAITKAPAPVDRLKGCVLEVAESGYTLHDKVVRYAKVVVGE